ncbi:YcaO-like family protein [Sorangium sp. So ce1389]|uniref:YcaO-like family protein n=1 Tax=Sorangium sp. So ce1389 TaxID=3133336 RepID=UPI003F5D6960
MHLRFDPIAIDTQVPKGFRAGTHRQVEPEETLRRVRRLMPVMGITRVANVTGLDNIGIPVVMVCRPNSRSLSVSQGKGLDLQTAQASGLMESVESYHAERIDLPLKMASYEELRYTHRVVEVEALPRIAGAQFHAHLPILWIEGYDLLQREPVWVPFEVVHTNYTVAVHRTMVGFVASSNGLASGNGVLEAISHGLCEAVERDATTLWRQRSAGSRAATRIELESIPEGDCRGVLDMYAQADVAVGVWEITSDIGIPAFLCKICDRRDNPLRRLGVTEGMGCHPVREIALLRALTEAAQSRLTQIAGSRDDRYPGQYVRQRDPNITAAAREELERPGPRRAFAEGPTFHADTFNADVAWELERLRAAGVTRAIAIELTRPELGIPVVRVVVPGLEPLSGDRSYVPGARARKQQGQAR